MTMAYLIDCMDNVRLSVMTSGLYDCVSEDVRQKLCGNKAEEVFTAEAPTGSTDLAKSFQLEHC